MNQPTRRDRMRPFEYLAIAAAFSLFSGIIILMTTRDPLIMIMGVGIIFILSLLMLALLAMTTKPDDNEIHDLEEQDRGEGRSTPH